MNISDVVSVFTKRFGDHKDGLYVLRVDPSWMYKNEYIPSDYRSEQIKSDSSSFFSVCITASIGDFVVHGQYEATEKSISILNGEI